MNDAAIEVRLENLLTNIEHQMLVDFSKATAKAAAGSALQSSRHLLEKARLIGVALDSFVTQACADAESVERAGKETRVLYDQAGTKLIQLQLRGIGHIKDKAQWASPSELSRLRSEVDRFYASAKGRLVDHQAGFGRSVPSVSAMHIQAGAGAVVQANSPGARAQTNVRVQAVPPALDEFEQAVGLLPFSTDEVDAIKAEIETMRAQLKKPSPSSIILTECGQTMRAILENWMAAAAQPAAFTVGHALWRALGMA